MAKGILGSKEVRWKWVVGNGVGAQGEGHDGMRGEIRGEGAWLRNTEDGETRMGDWWTGGRWSDVEGGTWLKESKGEMQGEMWSEARGGRRGWGERRSGRQCGAGWGEMGRGKKWRAKSLRTPFYQYSIYNQKDVLIIVLIILSHPLRSGHSHFHLEQ